MTTRIIAWILPAAALVLVAAIGVSAWLAWRSAVRSAEQEARAVATMARLEVIGVLRSVEDVTALAGASIETSSFNATQLEGFLQRFVDGNANVFGSTAAFEPRAFDPGVERYAPYVCRDRADLGRLLHSNLASPEYGYWRRGWYLMPLSVGRATWSDPYFDEAGGETLMVTYSVPLRQSTAAGARVVGVVTADLQLRWLSDLVEKIRVGRTGFAVLFSRLGRVLAHPDRSLLNAGLADSLPAEQRRRLEPLIARDMAGQASFRRIDLHRRRYRAVFTSVLPETGWTLVTLYPEDELMAGVWRLAAFEAGLGLFALAGLGLAVVVLSRQVTRPLRVLAERTRQFATGDLDLELPPVRSRDEIGTLTASFHHMRDSLKQHIERLRETTAAKERLESELKLAHRIQMDMLPTGTIGGPVEGFELAAHLIPARSVGGDLYVHLVDERRAFFMVGDVSGKGVGAALFMARTKTLFDALAMRESNPAALLESLNRQLCASNEHGMFVTGICGTLDPATGDVQLASAGHDPPLRIEPNRFPEPLALNGGPVLGLLDHASYPLNTLRLAQEECLIAFTDGVTDATDRSGVFFGPERLRQAVTDTRCHDARAFTTKVFEDVQRFAVDTPQADDITVMTIRFLGTRRGTI